MVALNQQGTFSWFERVNPPDDPAKTVHVVNHWRKPPRTRVHRPKRETGVEPRITHDTLKSV